MPAVPASPEEYARWGLGALPAEASAAQLYIDVVRRAVTNILYEDAPLSFYDAEHHQLRPARGFSLPRRVRGEDIPTEAHSMVGVRRLENLQACIEDVLRQGVKGDLIETGVLRGGAAIFMRAVLKAHHVTDRRVFACDTFVSQPVTAPSAAEIAVWKALQLLARIPSRRWRRRFFLWLQSRRAQKRFPDSLDPSDDLIEFVMWSLRNASAPVDTRGTGLDDVKSNFARYGLLDEQVVFLKGFFADTLPTAPIQALAVLRLDGDTYESTKDALSALYPKLSVGGYCIIDDYNAIPDCRCAVDEYREQQAIGDEVKAVDKIAIYWQKGCARPAQ